MKKTELPLYIKKLIREELEPKTDEVVTGSETSEITAKSLGIKDDIGKFYLVVKPKTGNKIEDIMSETTIFSFAKKVTGGLKIEDIAGIFTNRSDAKYEATQIMKSFDGQMDEIKKSMDEFRTHKKELDIKKA